ncbi:hypothetical protein PFISCL1PPCAC_19208, partial [Pristionchus fissidentatus]
QTCLMDLPNEILLQIFSLLPLHDQWKLRLNKRLEKIEGMIEKRKFETLTLAQSGEGAKNNLLLSVPRSFDDAFLLRLKKFSNYEFGRLHLMSVRIDSDDFRTAVFDILKNYNTRVVSFKNTVYNESELWQLMKGKELVVIEDINGVDCAPMYYRLIKKIFEDSETKFCLKLGSIVFNDLVNLIKEDEDFRPNYQENDSFDFLLIQRGKKEFMLSPFNQRNFVVCTWRNKL